MSEDKLWEHEHEFHDEEKWKAEKDDDGVQEKTYDSNKYVSGARRVSNGTVPMNILQFQYPLLYNCKKNRWIVLFFLSRANVC